MGKQYRYLKETDQAFIKEQKLFYMASCSGQEVNLSPKGYDSIRVIDRETLVYMDYPGSGNRTARDIAAGGDVTVVFNAFEGKPKILRLFCKGELINPEHPEFGTLAAAFNVPLVSLRRLIRLHIYAVESSCGMSVPLMRYEEDRNELRDWAVKKGTDGSIHEYNRDHATPPDLHHLKEE